MLLGDHVGLHKEDEGRLGVRDADVLGADQPWFFGVRGNKMWMEVLRGWIVVWRCFLIN